MKVLKESEVKNRLENLGGWKFNNNQIETNIELKDFKSAMNLVNRTADFAEEMNHHPDILIYSWNKVKFSLSTHSAGGITENDFKLAERINELKANISA